MLSIQISDIKDFMSHLLSKDTFDHFYFIEASIKMGVIRFRVVLTKVFMIPA